MPTFHIEQGVDLIQVVRLMHALVEDGVPIAVSPLQRANLKFVSESFDVDFLVRGPAQTFALPILVDHTEPLTQVGRITRPLIFARGVANRCRELWSSEREVTYSFSGLITPTRRDVLQAFVDRAVPQGSSKVPLSRDHGRGPATFRRLTRVWRGRDREVLIGPVLIKSTTRGRRYPVKAWDESHFELLGRTEFALCPNGDHIWTYRFFEAALCGAIPVVQSACDAYKGFRYHAMNDPIDRYKWAAEDAEWNFEAARRLLTSEPGILLSEALSCFERGLPSRG